jgi:hypothetical protein
VGAETSSPGQNEGEKHALNCTKLFALVVSTENARPSDWPTVTQIASARAQPSSDPALRLRESARQSDVRVSGCEPYGLTLETGPGINGKGRLFFGGEL